MQKLNKFQIAGLTYTAGSILHAVSNICRLASHNGFSLIANACFVAANVTLSKWGKHKVAVQAAHGMLVCAGGALYLAGIANGQTAVLFGTGHLSALALSFAENKKDSAFLKSLVDNRGLIAGGFSLISRVPLAQKMYHDVTERPNAVNISMVGAVGAWIIADVFLCLGKVSATKPEVTSQTAEDTKTTLTNWASKHLSKGNVSPESYRNVKQADRLR